MRFMDWDAPEFIELSATEKMLAITAAAAANAVEAGEGEEVKSVEDVDAGAAFVIPLLIPEELESGDGRQMAKDALSTRDLPISLLWQPSTGDGHNGSYIVGRIDTIERVENGLGNARGVFDTGPYGREAERLVRAKMLRGVSADLDKFEATVDGGELADELDPSKITSEKMLVSQARVMAATLVPKPAFQECTIELVSESNDPEGIPLEDGVYEDAPPAEFAAEYALSTVIASAAPNNPPKSWFNDPELTGPTPLTVDDDGRVYGHIATWDTDHVGMGSGVRPPRSRSNYAYFRTGLVRTDGGDDVAVGQLTLLGGHAPLDASAQMAVKHYDDTQSAVADVNAGEDEFGIWVAGGMRPSVTAEQVRVFRASAPSGDWRPINGVLELVACCQVNVPGFPVARARVASGSVMALVAAGTATLHKIRHSKHDELEARVASVERRVLERRRAELANDFESARVERINRLREAAAAARAELAPELDRRAQLSSNAEAIRKEFMEFKLAVAPDFKEALHPRDDDGKFKHVLLKLSDLLSPEGVGERNDRTAHAEEALRRADELDKAGDTEGAKSAAGEARDDLQSAAAEVDGEAKAALAEVAEDITQAAEEATKDAVEDVAKGDTPDIPGDQPEDRNTPIDVKLEDLDIGEVPEEIIELVEMMLDEFGESADPKSILSRMDNSMKHWLEGKGFESPEDMLKVIEKMMQRPIQPDIGQ